jgi:hypothetical protein
MTASDLDRFSGADQQDLGVGHEDPQNDSVQPG